ncbi:MAG: DUF1614 domain-containing protein [Clostridiales bacterium]|nr:DUF1614 domain-containing protein [Clostridiales bacterium]
MPFLLVLLLLLVGWIFFVLFAQVSAASFTALGLTPMQAIWLFTAVLLGSVINIPVWSRTVYRQRPPLTFSHFIFYYPPEAHQQVVYINVGGALIPGLFSLYLLLRGPFFPMLMAVAAVTLVAWRIARPKAGVGILLPPFIPPLVAVAVALIFVRGPEVSAVAFVGGVLGTLIGADLLHLKEVLRQDSLTLSIGGAGVFDGIFLVGILSSLLGAFF